MNERITLRDFANGAYYNELVRKSRRLHLNHPSTQQCQDSRWPFTDQLTSDQIVVMRDNYIGRRALPSRVDARHVYDRIFHMSKGWDSRATRDTRILKHDYVADARIEDREKAVPIGANTTYGKRCQDFYDFVSAGPGNRSEYTCQRFYRRGKIHALPPIPSVLER